MYGNNIICFKGGDQSSYVLTEVFITVQLFNNVLIYIVGLKSLEQVLMWKT